MKTRPLYLRLSDLAEELGVHQNTVERYVFRDVITPDADVEHGRTQQPIFLKSRLKEHQAAIRRHRESLEKAL